MSDIRPAPRHSAGLPECKQICRVPPSISAISPQSSSNWRTNLVECFLSEWKGEKNSSNISGRFDNNKKRKKKRLQMFY